MRHDRGRGGNVGSKGLPGCQSMESPAPRVKARGPKNECGEIIVAH